MSLKIYSTLSRTKEVFVPLNPPEVLIYLCGPTVYDLVHVGNFRGPIFYSFLRNWLEESGFKVKFVQNYTDIDDRIINKALTEKVSADSVALKYIEDYQTDFNKLGLRPFDLNPTVTESLPEIIKMIQVLTENGSAYVSQGDVNFEISKFPGYGKLSGRNPEELLEGVKVEPNSAKKSPLDFALWKAAKPGEPSWPSPWGPGRPGWHIECSAMIKQHMGDSIDIHGGGMDLIFPHHENEIAQSEAANCKPLGKYWVHYNMLEFAGAKMSKSLGNVKTGRAFMNEYHPEILKYMILAAHYRSTIEFSEDSIGYSISGLARIYSALAVAETVLANGPAATDSKPEFAKIISEARASIVQAFNDDLNTAEALARVFEVVRVFNGLVKRGIKATSVQTRICQDLIDFVAWYGRMTNLLSLPASQFLIELDNQLMKRKKIDRTIVEALVKERGLAREAKDFSTSDRLRNELVLMGISISDTTQGQHWEVAK